MHFRVLLTNSNIFQQWSSVVFRVLESVTVCLYVPSVFPTVSHNLHFSSHCPAVTFLFYCYLHHSIKTFFFFLTCLTFLFTPPAYSTFYIIGLVLSMQIPFVGFQPIRTSEHMAAAGQWTRTSGLGAKWEMDLEANSMCLLQACRINHSFVSVTFNLQSHVQWKHTEISLL